MTASYFVQKITTPTGSRLALAGAVADASLDVCVPFDVTLTTLPLSVPTAQGAHADLFNPKRVPEISVLVRQAGHLTVQGQAIEKREPYGDYTLYPQLDGAYEVAGFKGWQTRAQISIANTLPLPLTLLEINYKLFRGDT